MHLIPAVGRYDGGLSQLLRGDGHGQFVAVPVAESTAGGEWRREGPRGVRSRPRRVAGFCHLAQQRHQTLAFRNQPVSPAGTPWRIRPCKAPPAIPPPSGARISVTLDDGTTQIRREVFAGSGYYSQSTATCFFGWPDTNPPKALHVRWPSGITTEHSPSSTTGTLTIVAPR